LVPELSYRLIGRNVGLSKNTVGHRQTGISDHVKSGSLLRQTTSDLLDPEVDAVAAF